jgi:hypothetical protein
MARVQAGRAEVEAAYTKHISNGDFEKAQRLADQIGYVPSMPEGAGESFAMGAARSATLGFRPKMSAALTASAQALLDDADYGRAYDEALTRQMQYERRLSQSPAYTAGEVVGAFVGPATALGIGARGASAGMNALKAAGLGGAEGAVAGIGYSDRRGMDTLGDAGFGAATGALTGGAAATIGPKVGEMAGRALEAAFSGSAANAERAIGREIVGAGLTTADDALGAIQGLGPQGMLVDIAPGAGTQAMRRAGGGELATRLTERQRGARDRVLGILEDATGAKVADYDERLATLTSQLSRAGQDYNALARVEIPRELVDDILEIESPLVQRAVSGAKAAMNESQVAFVEDAYSVPLQYLDFVKRELDAIAQAAKSGPGSGVNGAEGQRAANLAADLRTRMDEISPEYARVRDNYAELAGSVDAMGASAANSATNPGGRQAMKVSNPALLDDVAAKVDEMSPQQRADFRLGAAMGADDVLAQRATRDGDVGNILRPDVPESVGNRVLDLASETSASAQAAREALSAESQMNETYRMLSRGTGSRTGVLDADASRVLRNSPKEMLINAVLPNGLTLETAEAMRSMLMRGDISEQEMRRMVDRGLKNGLFEATPEAVDGWFRVALAGTRAAQGVLSED